LVRAPDC